MALIHPKQLDWTQPGGCCDKTYFHWVGGYMGELGLDSGNTNMKVNGSLATPREFFVLPEPSKNIIILKVKILLAAKDHKNQNFGDEKDGLINGLNLFYQKDSINYHQLKAAKTNADLIIQSGNTDFFQSDKWNVINTYIDKKDLMIVTVNYSEYMGGLTLKAGSTDKLVLQVSDNLANLNSNELDSLQVQVFAVKEE